MKAYIVSFNPLTLLTHELTNYFDNSLPLILNWIMPFAGTIIVASNQDRIEITNRIAGKFPAASFLITEANLFNTAGMLPNLAWDFINNPKSSGRWEHTIETIAHYQSTHNQNSQGSLSY